MPVNFRHPERTAGGVVDQIMAPDLLGPLGSPEPPKTIDPIWPPAQQGGGRPSGGGVDYVQFPNVSPSMPAPIKQPIATKDPYGRLVQDMSGGKPMAPEHADLVQGLAIGKSVDPVMGQAIQQLAQSQPMSPEVARMLSLVAQGQPVDPQTAQIIQKLAMSKPMDQQQALMFRNLSQMQPMDQEKGQALRQLAVSKQVDPAVANSIGILSQQPEKTYV